MAKLIRKSGKDVDGLVTVVEIMELDGRSWFDFSVETMICINKFKLIYKNYTNEICGLFLRTKLYQMFLL